MSRKRTGSRTTHTAAPSTEPMTRRAASAGPRLLAAAVASAVCVCLSTVPAAAADTQPVVSRGVTIPAFYNPPTELPTVNGALIRTEPMSLGLSIPGLDGRPMPGTATRLMYKSTDSSGQPVAVTGAYIEPSAA